MGEGGQRDWGYPGLDCSVGHVCALSREGEKEQLARIRMRKRWQKETACELRQMEGKVEKKRSNCSEQQALLA